MNYSISLLLGMIITFSVSGFFFEVFNHPQTSSIFSIAIVSIIISIISLSIFQGKAKLYKPTILCFLFLVFYLIDFRDLVNLWNIGSYSLLILFIILCHIERIYYLVAFKSVLGAAVLLACWGYLQYLGCLSSYSEYFTLTGPYHNPAILAIILSSLLGAILNTFILFYIKLKKYRKMLVIIIAIALFCIPLLILTYARAAYISLIVSILYCLYLRFVTKKLRLKQLIYCGSIALCIGVSAGALYYLKPKSADGRLLIWKVSWQMIQDKPLTGFGKGGFAANYLYYQAKYMGRPSTSTEEKILAGNTHLAFNEPLRITVEYGLIGLFVYLTFIIWLLIPSKSRNSVTITCKSLLAGIAIWGFFAYPDQVFPLLTLWVIGIAFIINKKRDKKYYELPYNKYSKIAKIAVYSLTIICLSSQLWNKWEAYHKLYICLKSNNTELPNTLINVKKEMKSDINFVYLYSQILRANHSNIKFLYSIHLLETNFPTPGLFLIKGDYLKEKGKWEEAEKAYKLAAAMMPSLQTPRGKLAFLYNETGRRKEACRIAHKILTEDVKVYGFNTFKLHRDLKSIFEDKIK